jgi:autotransporter-associated beta strand protein
MRSKLGILVGMIALLGGIAVGVAPPATAATTRTWTGNGADANWSTALNWNPSGVPATADSLVFPPGAARLTNNNDIAADTAFATITFTGPTYSIGGNALSATEIAQAASAILNDTVTLPIHGLTRVRQDSAAGSVLGITGPIVLAADSTLEFANNQIVNVTGIISGTGAGITPTGAGRVVLSAANTYTGATKVVAGAGDLVIDGAQPTSAVTINSGALEGTGTIGALTVSAADQTVAVHSPGDPVGTMHARNTNLGKNSLLGVEGTGTGFGQFDQLAVTGTVTLGGDLDVRLSFKPAVGDKFVIIDNDGTDAVQGVLSGLTEGSVLADSNGNFFKISYKGGTGNDVELTTLAPPPVSTLTAPGSGGGPNIKSFGGHPLSFLAGVGNGGASVAAGNVLGGALDKIVVGSGAGVPSRITVYNPDGSPTATNFSPFGDGFTGGVNVGVADINGDGVDEIVVGAGPGGGPNVKVFDGNARLLTSFFAYDPGFHGGVKVAGADVTADGTDEIVTGPGPGGGPNVKALSADGSKQWLSFFAYDLGFQGGVNVAGADVDGDGRSEIVTGPGPGGGPHVRIFGAGTPMGPGFFAFAPGFTGGVSVGAFPDFGRGHDDLLVGAGPGGGPHVKGFLPDAKEIASFFAYDAGFHGGVNVAGAVLDLPK